MVTPYQRLGTTYRYHIQGSRSQFVSSLYTSLEHFVMPSLKKCIVVSYFVCIVVDVLCVLL